MKKLILKETDILLEGGLTLGIALSKSNDNNYFKIIKRKFKSIFNIDIDRNYIKKLTNNATNFLKNKSMSLVDKTENINYANLPY